MRILYAATYAGYIQTRRIIAPQVAYKALPVKGLRIRKGPNFTSTNKIPRKITAISILGLTTW